jgi:hypothetical protein
MLVEKYNMSSRNPVGRPRGHISYKEVKLNDKDYIVGILLSNDEPVAFVFDADDKDKVYGRSWHVSSNNYIASAEIYDGNRKQLFLHNLVSNRLDFPGKGVKESIDHINRIGFDNRKENLRLITQSEQNMNQTVRLRNITLPEGCELVPEDIPRHIWYIKANGAHGDRFAIEFKTEKLCWKTTSSKKISLKEKLNQAKEKLQALYTEYPHLNPFNTDKLELEESLKHSYNRIIEMSLYI